MGNFFPGLYYRSSPIFCQKIQKFDPRYFFHWLSKLEKLNCVGCPRLILMWYVNITTSSMLGGEPVHENWKQHLVGKVHLVGPTPVDLLVDMISNRVTYVYPSWAGCTLVGRLYVKLESNLWLSGFELWHKSCIFMTSTNWSTVEWSVWAPLV